MRTIKMLLVLAACAAMCGMEPTAARTLTPMEARQVASRFAVSHGLRAESLQQVAAPATRAKRAPGVAQAFYVFNNVCDGLQNGYVIVSGDDRALPVLGYSHCGTFDPNQLPPAMQAWLNYLWDEVASLSADDDATAYAPQRVLGAKIAPMLTCNWGQNEPYNMLIPMVETDKQGVTGCVATAMAQVMYYHRWPATSTIIPEYTSETLAIFCPELPATSFDWNSMQDNYTSTSTGASVNAVAKLMQYCAQSLEMAEAAAMPDSSESASSSARSFLKFIEKSPV